MEKHEMNHSLGILAAYIAFLCGVTATFAADQAADKAAIEKAIESYTAAFNAADAEALAKHWSSEAVYINPITGDQAEGREAIEKAFKAILADLKDTKLAVDVESIRFISPRVAVVFEDGIAQTETRDRHATAHHHCRSNLCGNEAIRLDPKYAYA
jgi:uncharacterized protein (TIGR02246 family)